MRVDQRMKEIKRLEETQTYLGATDYSAVVVKHSQDRGPTERLATDSRLESLRRKLAADIDRLADEKLVAISLIGMLEDARMQDILWEYYIRAVAKNWEEAGARCGYSERQARRIHGQALQLLRMSLNVRNDL